MASSSSKRAWAFFSYSTESHFLLWSSGLIDLSGLSDIFNWDFWNNGQELDQARFCTFTSQQCPHNFDLVSGTRLASVLGKSILKLCFLRKLATMPHILDFQEFYQLKSSVYNRSVPVSLVWGHGQLSESLLSKTCRQRLWSSLAITSQCRHTLPGIHIIGLNRQISIIFGD